MAHRVRALAVLLAAVVAAATSPLASVSMTPSYFSTVSNPLNEARVQATAALLADGTVLLAGGAPLSASSEAYADLTQLWTSTAAMPAAVTLQAGAALQNGAQVVVAGGFGSGNAVGLVQVFDGATWTSGAPLTTARQQHTATAVSSTQVLVVGGLGADDSGLSLNSLELIDVGGGGAATTTTQAAVLTVPRHLHTATASTYNSKTAVIVVGGISATTTSYSALSSCEQYDPAAHAFVTGSPCGSLNFPRSQHTATAFADGSILVVGGVDDSGSALASVELYSPSTGAWTAVSPLTTARYLHTATLLQDGTVIVAGGYDGTTALNSAEIYHPSTISWAAAATNLGTARYAHSAIATFDKSGLLAGGLDASGVPLTSAELYGPTVTPIFGTADTMTTLSAGAAVSTGSTTKTCAAFDKTLGARAGFYVQTTSIGSYCCVRRGFVSGGQCSFPTCSSTPHGVNAFLGDAATDNSDCWDTCYMDTGASAPAWFSPTSSIVFVGNLLSSGALNVDASFTVSTVKDVFVYRYGAWNGAYLVQATSTGARKRFGSADTLFACASIGTVDGDNLCVLSSCGSPKPGLAAYIADNSVTPAVCYANCYRYAVSSSS